jgi:hypothetical protein
VLCPKVSLSVLVCACLCFICVSLCAYSAWPQPCHPVPKQADRVCLCFVQPVCACPAGLCWSVLVCALSRLTRLVCACLVGVLCLSVLGSVLVFRLLCPCFVRTILCSGAPACSWCCLRGCPCCLPLFRVCLRLVCAFTSLFSISALSCAVCACSGFCLCFCLCACPLVCACLCLSPGLFKLCPQLVCACLSSSLCAYELVCAYSGLSQFVCACPAVFQFCSACSALFVLEF